MSKKYDDEFDEFEEEKKSSPIRKLFFMIILLIVLIIIYGIYIGTTGLLLNNYVIKDNISDSYNNFKIAHFSDIHYGKTINKKELKKIVKKINDTNPDIIVFTGDLVDQTVIPTEEEITFITFELSKLDSTYGKYYISGDHDIKLDSYDKIMEDAGFISLNDSYDIIFNKKNETLFISGINYKSTGDYLKELKFEELPTYKIIIMHTPDSFDKVKDYNFNLALAGHSLNGVINIPYIGGLYKVDGAKKYNESYYKVNNTNFYISNGIGTDEFEFRLFNRPSFNVYKLKK